MAFTLEQAMAAQRALREASGLPAEQFSLDSLIGMLSDEIETLREAGTSDAEIAGLINGAAGAGLSAADVAENYAPPETRKRG